MTVLAVAASLLAGSLAAGPATADRGSAGSAPSSLSSSPSAAAPSAPAARRAALPGGGRKIFARKRFLTAFYGTAGTGSLGVLGEMSPDTAYARIRKAGQRFVGPKENLVPVYELIVTVADPVPGTDGDFNHDVLHSRVQAYVDAAERNNALLLLDLQPGHSDFLTVAQRWQWALESPNVGLALDPEWRMTGGQVPGQAIGSVTAAEVNRVSAWLSALVADRGLPEKVFMLHQFSPGMVDSVRKVRPRPGLALVQHVDGFGTPAQKLATYSTVAFPKKFTMGFKVFLDEDSPRMTPKAVRRKLPDVRFVSYQ